MTSLKNPTVHQRRILEILLSKYESSRTFSGQNKVSQTFSVKPEDVFPDYSDDFTDTALISRFEEEIRELECDGLVSAERDRRGISRIVANKEAAGRYPALLGVTDKRTTLNEAAEILRRHMGGHEYVRRLCEQQLERVSGMKKPDLAPDNVRLEQVLRCLDYILGNRSEILERELSIELFGDSKLYVRCLRARWTIWTYSPASAKNPCGKQGYWSIFQWSETPRISISRVTARYAFRTGRPFLSPVLIR